MKKKKAKLKNSYRKIFEGLRALEMAECGPMTHPENLHPIKETRRKISAKQLMKEADEFGRMLAES